MINNHERRLLVLAYETVKLAILAALKGGGINGDTMSETETIVILYLHSIGNFLSSVLLMGSDWKKFRDGLK